jgi:hypothetical protein
MQTTEKQNFHFLLQNALKSKIHIFPKKVIGPFSKLDILHLWKFETPIFAFNYII